MGAFFFLLALVLTLIKLFDPDKLSKVDIINLWSCLGTMSALAVTIGSVNESRIEKIRESKLNLVNNYYRNSSDLLDEIYNAIPTAGGIKEVFHGSVAIKTAIDDLNKQRIKEIRSNFGFSELRVFLVSYEHFALALKKNKLDLEDEYDILLGLSSFRNHQIIVHLRSFLEKLIGYDLGENKGLVEESLQIIKRIKELRD